MRRYGRGARRLLPSAPGEVRHQADQPRKVEHVHGRAAQGDPGHVELQPRERGHLLHQLRGEGGAVAGAAAAGGRLAARHHQAQDACLQLQARGLRRGDHRHRAARSAQGPRVFPPERADPPRHQGGQHPARRRRDRADRGLRCLGLARHRARHLAPEGSPHVRGHALLDGARGDGAEPRVRLQGGHLVLRHHGHRDGDRHRALPQVSAHEGAHADAAERAAHAGHGRGGARPVPRLRQDLPQDDLRVPAEGPRQAALRARAAQALLLQEGQGPALPRADAGHHRAQHGDARAQGGAPPARRLGPPAPHGDGRVGLGERGRGRGRRGRPARPRRPAHEHAAARALLRRGQRGGGRRRRARRVHYRVGGLGARRGAAADRPGAAYAQRAARAQRHPVRVRGRQGLGGRHRHGAGGRGAGGGARRGLHRAPPAAAGGRAPGPARAGRAAALAHLPAGLGRPGAGGGRARPHRLRADLRRRLNAPLPPSVL